MVIKTIDPTRSSVPTIQWIKENYQPSTADQTASASGISNLSFREQPRTVDENSDYGTRSFPINQPTNSDPDYCESQQILSQFPIPPSVLAGETPNILTTQSTVANLTPRSPTDRRSTPHPKSPGIARGPPIVYSNSHLSSLNVGEIGYCYGEDALLDQSNQSSTLEEEVGRLRRQIEYMQEELITKEQELNLASNVSSFNRETAITVISDLQNALADNIRLQDENDQYRSSNMSLRSRLATTLGDRDKYKLKSGLLSTSLDDVLNGYEDMRRNRHQEQLSRQFLQLSDSNLLR